MKRFKFRNDYARERLKEALAHAKKHKLKRSLSESLSCLHAIAKNCNGYVDLCTDFAPLSFTWGIINSSGHCTLNGGLIFHGPHDGYGDGSAPTYTVSLDPSHGWQLHT